MPWNHFHCLDYRCSYKAFQIWFFLEVFNHRLSKDLRVGRLNSKEDDHCIFKVSASKKRFLWTTSKLSFHLIEIRGTGIVSKPTHRVCSLTVMVVSVMTETVSSRLMSSNSLHSSRYVLILGRSFASWDHPLAMTILKFSGKLLGKSGRFPDIMAVTTYNKKRAEIQIERRNQHRVNMQVQLLGQQFWHGEKGHFRQTFHTKLSTDWKCPLTLRIAHHNLEVLGQSILEFRLLTCL